MLLVFFITDIDSQISILDVLQRPSLPIVVLTQEGRHACLAEGEDHHNKMKERVFMSE